MNKVKWSKPFEFTCYCFVYVKYTEKKRFYHIIWTAFGQLNAAAAMYTKLREYCNV